MVAMVSMVSPISIIANIDSSKNNSRFFDQNNPQVDLNKKTTSKIQKNDQNSLNSKPTVTGKSDGLKPNTLPHLDLEKLNMEDYIQTSKDSIINLIEEAKSYQYSKDYSLKLGSINQKIALIEKDRQREAIKLVKIDERQKTVEELAGARVVIKSNGEKEVIPLVKVVHDLNASITSNGNNLDLSNNITSYSFRVGVWDSGRVRSTHQEIRDKTLLGDSGSLSDHATRVAGIIAARGVTAIAKSMSSAVGLTSYDWNSDISELQLNAPTAPNQENKIPISNHSYNFSSGWYVSSGTYVFVGHTTMGQYNSDVEAVDALLSSLPYLTKIRSAGNDRTENPKTGDQVRLNFWSQEKVSYNPSIHPPGDGIQKGGFNTISYSGCAKNVITVGAVNDAVSSNQRDLTLATLTTYTAWGPTDDGRVKPDIVANGSSLYTCSSNSDTSYAHLSGTSAAAPVVSSIAALLTQYWNNSQPSNNTCLKSSTLKGLLIHGADDLGNPGPDYQFGWGLANANASLDIIKAQITKPNEDILIEDSINGPSPSLEKVIEFYWDGSSPTIKATLCWTDPKGTATDLDDSNTSKLINDLDIVIIDPQGNQHMPFVMPFTLDFNSESLSLPAIKGNNKTDNVEMIVVNAPTKGLYRVVTSIKAQPSNPQEYSLIITGTQKDPNEGLNPEDPYIAWATTYFGSQWQSIENSQPNQDFDQDGFANWAEFNINTDPTDPLSKISCQILGIKINNGTKEITIRVTPPAAPGAGTIRIISKENLTQEAWDGPSIELPASTMPFQEIIIESSADNAFFRAEYTPPTKTP